MAATGVKLPLAPIHSETTNIDFSLARLPYAQIGKQSKRTVLSYLHEYYTVFVHGVQMVSKQKKSGSEIHEA